MERGTMPYFWSIPINVSTFFRATQLLFKSLYSATILVIHYLEQKRLRATHNAYR